MAGLVVLAAVLIGRFDLAPPERGLRDIGDQEGEGGMGSRVELFAAIRCDGRVEGLSIRQLAERHKVHRRTVRQALGSAVPPERKPPVRVSCRLEELKPVIDAMMREDLDAPRKQKHTARRVLVVPPAASPVEHNATLQS